MTYKASWDNLTKIITAGVTVVFVAILTGPYFFGQEIFHPTSYFIGALVVLIYFISYALSPVSYSINSETLVIHRLAKDVIIDRKDIANVELLDDKQLKWSIRVFGSGGLFGFYGKFYNSKLGRMTWYATRRKNAVLIQTVNQKKLILTPNEIDDFVKKLDVRLVVLS